MQFFLCGIMLWACVRALGYIVMQFTFHGPIDFSWSKLKEEALEGSIAGLTYLSIRWLMWKRKKPGA